MKFLHPLTLAYFIALLMTGCGSDSTKSENNDSEIITIPTPEEPPLEPEPEPSNPIVVDISQYFQPAIADNIYVFSYKDSSDQTHIAMVPKMARLTGGGTFKLANEQLYAIQIVDDVQLSRAFSNLTLPLLITNTSAEIRIIIAETLNIDPNHIYSVSKSGTAQYLPTSDQGFDNSYDYFVNGQASVLRLNASDYPVETKIPFAGEWQGQSSINLDYQQAHTPYFKVAIRLFADTDFVADIITDIYLKGTLNQVNGSNDIYQLDGSW